MALTTKAAVQDKVTQLGGWINGWDNYFKNGQAQAILQNQISILQNKERQFLANFGVNSFDELNKKLQELRENYPLIQRLNGSQLTNVFLNSARNYMEQRGLGPKNQISKSEELEREKEKFINYLITDLNQVDKTNIGETVRDIVFSAIGSLGSGTSLRADAGLTGSIKYNGKDNLERVLEQIVIKELTPTARQRIIQFNREHDKLLNSTSMELETTSNSLIITHSKHNLASITRGYTELEVVEKLKNNEITDADFARIQNLVIVYINSKGPPDPDFRIVVKRIIQSAGKHIFYGGNIINGYTGLLGEIQAAYFMEKLKLKADSSSLPAGVDPSKIIIEWHGGDRSKGWEPPEDLLVYGSNGNVSGVQVKNSASDKIRRINFLDKKIENMGFSVFPDDSRLDQFKKGLEEVYELYYFNITVDYNDVKDLWEPNDNNPQFNGVRGTIEKLRSLADRTIGLMSAEAMKMSVVDGVAGGNVAYLIGGKNFVSASSVLQQVQTEVMSGKFDKLRISAHYERTGGGNGTIADVYNTHNKQYLPVNIKLRSSYLFD